MLALQGTQWRDAGSLCRLLWRLAHAVDMAGCPETAAALLIQERLHDENLLKDEDSWLCCHSMSGSQ